MKAAFEIKRSGPVSSIQGNVRSGYRHLGMPLSGPQDSFATRVANCLVGNPPDASVMELTGGGVKLKARADMIISMCGFAKSVRIGSSRSDLWRSMSIKEGETIDIAPFPLGRWLVIAVQHGFFADEVMGSTSTYMRVGIGGLGGRLLRDGDVLYRNDGDMADCTGRRLNWSDLPDYECGELRVLKGPHMDWFTKDAFHQLCESDYVLTSRLDRMGYRLDGDAIEVSGRSLLTEATCRGAIQVPPDGQPVILQADSQTTGGYPIIGVVIEADQHLAAQIAVGQSVRFQEVSLQEALTIRRKQHRILQRVAAATATLKRT